MELKGAYSMSIDVTTTTTMKMFLFDNVSFNDDSEIVQLIKLLQSGDYNRSFHNECLTTLVFEKKTHYRLYISFS